MRKKLFVFGLVVNVVYIILDMCLCLGVSVMILVILFWINWILVKVCFGSFYR